jgi:hypothetical protein
MPVFKDLTNRTYGRLTTKYRVIDRSPTVWFCICSCGNTAEVRSSKLVNGHTKSCGCLQKEKASFANKKHGQSTYPNNGRATKEYNTWALMRRRCSPVNTNKDRFLYFEQGIFVCERWKIFENFFADMGVAPTSKHSIDRIDGTKGYSPENCRWADSKTQVRNRKCTVIITFNCQTLSLGEWAEKTKIPYKRLHARLKRGWDVKKTFTTPV